MQNSGGGDGSRIENRNNPRFNCWCNLQFHNSMTWKRGIATDISETGIHIVTLHPLNEGKRIKLCFDEPGSLDYQTIVGEVVWKNDQSPFESKSWIAPGMGIQFLSKLPIEEMEFAFNNKTYEAE